MNRRQLILGVAIAASTGRVVKGSAQSKQIPEDLTSEEISYLGIAATWLAMYDDANDRFRDTLQDIDPELLEDAATLGPVLSGPAAWIAISEDVANVTPPTRFEDVHQDISDAFESYSSAASYLFDFLGSSGRQRDIDRSNEAIDEGNSYLADIRDAIDELLPDRSQLDR